MNSDCNSITEKDKNLKMTLADYYNSLPKPVHPKTDFVREIASVCGVDPYTVRLWISGRTKPGNPEHVKILSEKTGIESENLWEK